MRYFREKVINGRTYYIGDYLVFSESEMDSASYRYGRWKKKDKL